MKLKASEIKLIGQWIFDGKRIEKDSVCQRIEYLTKNILIKVAADESGWNVLYKDPEDNRYWQLRYDNSDSHGGGPPTLEFVQEEDIRLYYAIDSNGD